jgi:hypothetical protein
MNDVALFAVLVEQQREAGIAVGIVFDRRNGGGDTALVPTEVDDPILTLVAAAVRGCQAYKAGKYGYPWLQLNSKTATIN